MKAKKDITVAPPVVPEVQAPSVPPRMLGINLTRTEAAEVITQLLKMLLDPPEDLKPMLSFPENRLFEVITKPTE